MDWVAEAHGRGLRIVMLSNNFSERVRTIAAQLGVGCIPNALKPLPFGFSAGQARLGLRRREIAVVGDQLFTDVLGGKLCGLYTILTEPIEAKDFRHHASLPVLRAIDVAAAADAVVKLALIGDPVEHSRSPQLHREFMSEAGIDGSYVAVRVPHVPMRRHVIRAHARGRVIPAATSPIR